MKLIACFLALSLGSMASAAQWACTADSADLTLNMSGDVDLTTGSVAMSSGMVSFKNVQVVDLQDVDLTGAPFTLKALAPGQFDAYLRWDSPDGEDYVGVVEVTLDAKLDATTRVLKGDATVHKTMNSPELINTGLAPIDVSYIAPVTCVIQ